MQINAHKLECSTMLLNREKRMCCYSQSWTYMVDFLYSVPLRHEDTFELSSLLFDVCSYFHLTETFNSICSTINWHIYLW